jgi:hypothetical protein
MGGDEHVHSGEGAAPLPGGGAQVRVGLCGGGVQGKTETPKRN